MTTSPDSLFPENSGLGAAPASEEWAPEKELLRHQERTRERVLLRHLQTLLIGHSAEKETRPLTAKGLPEFSGISAYSIAVETGSFVHLKTALSERSPHNTSSARRKVVGWADSLKVKTTRIDLHSESEAFNRNHKLSEAFQCIEDAIREIAKLHVDDAHYILSELDQVFCSLMRTAEIAEGRMRPLVMRLRGWAWSDKARTFQLPDELRANFDKLRTFSKTKSGDATLPSEMTIETAARLVASLLSAIPDLRNDIVVDPRGNGVVAITWGDRLRWLVEPARLPWPGVNVTAVSIDASRGIEANYFHFAGSALAHALSLLKAGQGK